jgi:hypothetical protein
MKQNTTSLAGEHKPADWKLALYSPLHHAAAGTAHLTKLTAQLR